jgi:RNA polymerase sigma-70 factor (sigma-E family)
MPPDEAGFEDFVQARWTTLVRYAYALTGDRGAAEDVVQTVLAATWGRWSSIRSDRPEAYVRTAIARGVVSRRRRLGRRPAERPAGDDLPLGRVPTPDGADGRALRAALWSELAGLPPRMRAVVVLRLWEDLPEAEVAAVLGCSVGSVKSQLSRGLARLRERTGLQEAVGLSLEGGTAPTTRSPR